MLTDRNLILTRAYEQASDIGKPVALLVPTSPILVPVNPIKVAARFEFTPALCVYTAADALNDVYHTPDDPRILRRYAREFTDLAAALEAER